MRCSLVLFFTTVIVSKNPSILLNKIKIRNDAHLKMNIQKIHKIDKTDFKIAANAHLPIKDQKFRNRKEIKSALKSSLINVNEELNYSTYVNG